MPPQPDNLETDSRFPSGEWVDFYIQPSISRDRRRMGLCLTFRSGLLTGEGMDGVGEFLIKGRYDLKSGEVTSHKYYVRQHSVFYRGWNEGKGIWGVWEISSRGWPAPILGTTLYESVVSESPRDVRSAAGTEPSAARRSGRRGTHVAANFAGVW